MLNKTMTDHFLKTLAGIDYGSLSLRLPDGRQYFFEGVLDGAHGELNIHSLEVITHLMMKGDIGFAEDYRDGLWDTPDLAALLQFGLENDAALNRCLFGSAIFRFVARLMNFARLNTLGGSKRNIHTHYDLGNAFYALWLDPSMTYSSALFTPHTQSLTDAQHNKYDRILDCLGNTPGNVLEIGCGWGGFAERALSTRDCDVKGITLSDEQHRYATDRLRGNATIALEDYRHQQGTYDNIVSIEMFEAVGERYWPTYFSKMASLLKPQGTAVVQTITIGDQYFDAYRKGGDMIRSFIFPGGMLPSPERFTQEAQKAGLNVAGSFDFGKDYATTLRHWLESFEARRAEVLALGFDNRFIRLWRLYLSACIASFTVGRTSVMQMELRHA